MRLATQAAVWGIEHRALLDARDQVDVLIERTILSNAVNERLRIEEAKQAAMVAGQSYVG